MALHPNRMKQGFWLAGFVNIFGIVLFSKGFSNETIAQVDPIVMGNFGLLMIMLWGAAYLSIAQHWQKLPLMCLVFALEKGIYFVVWVNWILSSGDSLPAIYEQDIFAGVFYTIYGLNDAVFMLFFLIAYWQAKKSPATIYS